MEKVIVRMKEVADENDSKLALLAVPAHLDVEDYSHVWRVDREQEPDYRRANLTDTVKRIADVRAVSCLNLFPFLRKHHKAHDLYFKGDDHWNDVGQDLAAERTAMFLEKQKLIDIPDPES